MKTKLILTYMSFAIILNLGGQNSASYNIDPTFYLGGLTDCSAFGQFTFWTAANGVQRNTATGYWSMGNLKYGDECTADGAYSLFSGNASTGNYNTAIGHSALYSNTAGEDNAATGYKALYSNDVGVQNTANGSGALQGNTNGLYNTANGFQALNNNGSGPLANTPEGNTAAGFKALFFNNDGSFNTAVGSGALAANTYGINNTAMGYNALTANSSITGADGRDNTAVGCEAMVTNVYGIENTAVGKGALSSNFGAGGNTAVGTEALYSNDANDNTALGSTAAYGITSGSENVHVGYAAGYFSSTSSQNVAVGSAALGNASGAGDYCTGVGVGVFNSAPAGKACTGLGAFGWTTSNSYTNATTIGYLASGTAKDKVRLGNTNITHIETFAAVTTVSDGRFKINQSEEDVKGLDFILRLRPVTYYFDNKKYTEFTNKNVADSILKKNLLLTSFNEDRTLYSGFIAQEMEKAGSDAGYDFSGLIKPGDENGNYSVAYAKLVVPLVKAVQEQQKMISLQKDAGEKLLQAAEDRKQATQSILGIQNSMNSQPSGSDQKNFLMDAQPNPFNDQTTVSYTLPENVSTAQLIIYDLQEKQVDSYSLAKASRSLIISSQKLTAGIYIYSIVADGKLMGSKSIVVTQK